MHVLAILFVLSALVLAFGVIGGMLFAHRERIGEALGMTVAATLGHELSGYRKVRTRRASVAGHLYSIPPEKRAAVRPFFRRRALARFTSVLLAEGHVGLNGHYVYACPVPC